MAPRRRAPRSGAPRGRARRSRRGGRPRHRGPGGRRGICPCPSSAPGPSSWPAGSRAGARTGAARASTSTRRPRRSRRSGRPPGCAITAGGGRATRSAHGRRPGRLTETEDQVARLAAAGLTNREVGGRGLPQPEERRGRPGPGVPEARDPVARRARGVAGRRPPGRGTGKPPFRSRTDRAVASRRVDPSRLEVPAMTRHRLVVTLATASLLVAACGGAAPSTPASPAASAVGRASASTELVADIDVGGRTLHLVCLGPTDTGEPTDPARGRARVAVPVLGRDPAGHAGRPPRCAPTTAPGWA